MRLCWNDGFGCPLRDIKPEDAKFYYDIGFRVVGMNVGDADAPDAEIDRAKNIPFDHESLIQATTQLEPWKTFSLEHISDRNLIKEAYDYIEGIASRIGHKWPDPNCTRERFEKGLCKQ